MKFVVSIVATFCFFVFNTNAQNNVFKTEPLRTYLSVGFSAPVGTHKGNFDAAYSPNLQMNFGKSIFPKISLNTGIGMFGNGVRKTVPYFKYEIYSFSIPLTIQYEFYNNFNAEVALQNFFLFFI